ncbi:ATP-binding protein [Solirubrobacter phytolaccae]|uniref:ATP-binding protein n=1 Tax=Solirubrobacter phytolaccae TaxID=1404360 RepID=UPI0022CDD40B|nr:LuxR family transcriptional regulator [Solirubrobacter phytolaccae]
MTDPNPAASVTPLVGRSGEVAVLEEAARTSGLSVVEIVGEAGIGKTTLLDHLGASADRAGALVLRARCSEYERDVPYALVIDALDPHLARHGAPAGVDLAALGGTFPALAANARASSVERHELHRAVRGLLERLAAPRGLALILDDLHWADPASIALVASIVRRPPARLLLAIAHRHRQADSSLDPELRRAADAGGARRLTLGPLTPDEASRLLSRPQDAELRRLYEESGGNPFHLMQLARTESASGTVRIEHPGHGEVPGGVREAVLSETAPLGADARALLDGASVVGDPFEIDFAAEVAGLERGAALEALDVLVAADLVRVTEDVRRFRFRHPIVRRTVYETVGPGRRLAAHARAAAGLERDGAGPVALAHHVEQSAAPGDSGAVALLAQAAAEVAPRAPQTAVHWLSVARTLARGADEGALLGPLAGALAGSGRFADARNVLLELPTSTELIVACAMMDRLLGDHDGARARLRTALAGADVGDAVALNLELAAHASLRGDPLEMRVCARDALDGAAGDPVPTAAATAALAMAAYTLEAYDEARVRGLEATALIGALSDEQLGTRLEMLLFLGWAQYFGGEFAVALEHFTRGTAIARRAGSAVLALELAVGEALGLLARGRIAEALDVADGAVEDARPLGSAQSLLWALYAQTMVLEAAGDPAAAVRAGEEAVALTAGLEPSSIVAGCGSALAAALVATGEGARATSVLLELQGGPDLPRFFAGQRSGCYELLVRAALLSGDRAAASSWADRAESAAALPLGVASAARARALVALHDGDARTASTLALESVAITDELELPVESARGRILAGRALAAASDRDAAAEQLRAAEGLLVDAPAGHLRAEAVRELRRIGRRINRAGRAGRASTGTAGLSVRELEIARLVAGGLTNRAVAEALFLSQKTVESHLASAFVKLGIRTRGALAAALET